MDSAEVRQEPRVIPDPEASPGVVESFRDLAALIGEEPDEALEALRHRSPQDAIEAARALAADAQSVGDRTLRVVALIFERRYDVEVDFDPDTAHAAARVRESGSEQGARVRRVATYARRLAMWQTVEHEDSTLRAVA